MPQVAGGAALVVWAGALVALVILVQVEAARVPIDDPTTHLELTMIHEVMILDHSGPELAASSGPRPSSWVRRALSVLATRCASHAWPAWPRRSTSACAWPWPRRSGCQSR
ncbi:MAG: hypothetical protein IPO09_15465 [Anaeromyxobacter sp.]|nr:hypothetical protein [Anaeromyxobacter sp.]